MSHSNSCMRWHWHLKGLTHERGWSKSVANLSVFPVKRDLSNGTLPAKPFSQDSPFKVERYQARHGYEYEDDGRKKSMFGLAIHVQGPVSRQPSPFNPITKPTSSKSAFVQALCAPYMESEPELMLLQPLALSTVEKATQVELIFGKTTDIVPLIKLSRGTDRNKGRTNHVSRWSK
jgi:hypothetical protein